jgi:hypothetical protein
MQCNCNQDRHNGTTTAGPLVNACFYSFHLSTPFSHSFLCHSFNSLHSFNPVTTCTILMYNQILLNTFTMSQHSLMYPQCTCYVFLISQAQYIVKNIQNKPLKHISMAFCWNIQKCPKFLTGIITDYNIKVKLNLVKILIIMYYNLIIVYHNLIITHFNLIIVSFFYSLIIISMGNF